MIKYWVRTNKFTAQVNCIDGFIVWTTPCFRKFEGQQFENLTKWAGRTFGGLQVEILH